MDVTPRRNIIKAVAALALLPVAAKTLPGASFATVGKPKSNQIYDVHQHYLPKAYADALLKHGKKGEESDGLPAPAWNVDDHLRFMDDKGIDISFLSLASPHPFWGDTAETISLVREINDEGARLVNRHGDRFRLLATLPLPDVASSLEEIRYAYDNLKASGIKLPTNAGGIYLGDERFEPIFEELNRRKAVVVLHPAQSYTHSDNGYAKYPPAIASYLHETTQTVLNLILSGTLERYPDIKFVIPHGGSLLTSIAERLDAFQALAQAKSATPIGSIKEHLRSLYYDLAGFPVPNQLYGLLNMTDSSHILFGSDYPYAYDNFIQGQMDKFASTDLLTDKQKKEICFDNIKRVFNIE